MPNPPTNRLDIFEKNQYNLEEAARKSRAWFSQQVLLLSKQRISPNRIMADGSESTLTPNIIPGNLYMYFYDPKLKQKLPYYDRFPLVMPLKREADGFLGLNFHYLPLRYRVSFMRKLMPLAIYDDEDEIKRIRVTYPLLDSSSRFKEFRPCIKKYLYSRIKSRILKVQPEEWDIALYLPVHQFRKEKAKTVWQESVQEIRSY